MRIRIDLGEGHIEVQGSTKIEIEALMELLLNATNGLKETKK